MNCEKPMQNIKTKNLKKTKLKCLIIRVGRVKKYDILT